MNMTCIQFLLLFLREFLCEKKNHNNFVTEPLVLISTLLRLV